MADSEHEDEELVPGDLAQDQEGTTGEASEGGAPSEDPAKSAEPEDGLTVYVDADPDEDADLGDLGEKGRNAIRHLRDNLKRSERERREVAARLAELQAKAEPEAPTQEPTLESCGYDDEEFRRRYRAFTLGQIEREKQQRARQEEEEAHRRDYSERISQYEAGKARIAATDFADVEDAVRSVLTREQQTMLIRNVADPATVIYALGKSEKKLAELAAIKDHDRFAFALGKIEGSIKVERRTPPPVEKPLKGGAASAAAVASAQTLEAARRRAEQSGDYSEVLRIKRQMKGAA